MLVLDLVCELEHRFEGWFGSSADYESQLERGLIGCPLCGSARVQRRPSAPHLNVAHLRGLPAPGTARSKHDDASTGSASEPAATGQARASGQQPSELEQLQMQALQMVRQVLAKTEDVGERFADEARRMHYGEAQARAIRGQASAEQAAALSEEGIEVMALPEILKQPLQ